MKFHQICGRHIRMSNDQRIAERVGNNYSHGLIFSNKPLSVKDREIFQLKIEKMDERWAGSLVRIIL